MKKAKAIVLTAVFVILSAAIGNAVPLAENVLRQLKKEGRFEDFIHTMSAARARGMDQPALQAGRGFDLKCLPGQSTIRVLVILIDFSDEPYTAGATAATPADFDSVLFSRGRNPTGSMTEFYLENSYGDLIMEGDVVGWYRAAESTDYYAGFCDGSHGMGDYPYNAIRLVEEAVDLADPDVDFSSYDNDGDGYVDGIFVVHAGAGYEQSGNSCDIHSHMWYIDDRPKDGVIVSVYSTEPEESAYSQSISDIGVYCHEFGHVLGLPDLYDYDYSSAGAGRWAEMAFGCYNGNSRIPAHFCVWSKMELGWLTAVDLTGNLVAADLPAIELNRVGYRLWPHGQASSEYFMVENRQRVGFDAALPGSGILIWHIDESIESNDDEWHPLVFLEQADGEFDLQYLNNLGDAQDAYPAGGYYPYFHDRTLPDSRAYDSSATEVAVWNMSPSGSIMTADLDVVWSRPLLFLDEYLFSDAAGGDGDGVLEAGETVQLTFAVGNEWKAVATADIVLAVDDPSLILTLDAVTVGPIPTGGTADNFGTPLEFDIPPGHSSRIVTFSLEISCDGGAFTTSLIIDKAVGKIAVLVVDGDGGDNLEGYYTQPLVERRVPFVAHDAEVLGSPALGELAGSDLVIWFSGDYRPEPLAPGDVATMQNHLDAGGKLFLTGQGIAPQLAASEPAFLSDYLKANYLSTSIVPGLTPDPASQIFSGLDLIVIAGSGSIGNQTDPDHIAAVGGGAPELRYLGSADAGAVSFTGEYTSLFFSFGYEGITAGNPRYVERDTVMYRVLDFFGIDTTGGWADVSSLGVGPGEVMHLVDHWPIISWAYDDPGGNPQEAYHLQVGIDDDWPPAEIWDFGPVASSATSTVYAGPPLVDGHLYYVRVRVRNGVEWSMWTGGMFRMNSVPGPLYGMIPDNLAGVATATPDLAHYNADDGEGDILTYGYEVYSDSQLTVLVAQADNQPEEYGSTSSWAVDVPLADDSIYYWRVRASDDFEDGPWSAAASFWVNADNQPPAPFGLISPVDEAVLVETLPILTWQASADGDRFDAVHYALIIASEAGFLEGDTIFTGPDTVYAVPDSLIPGREYFWKVLAIDNFDGITACERSYSYAAMLAGDANGDHIANVGDVVYIVNHVFKGGPLPEPVIAGDANHDCTIDVGDAVYLVNFVFKGGPSPLVGCE